MTGIWAVVPVKEFEGAKQRLSSSLEPDERRLLARTMLEDVLDAVSAVQQLAGLLVVTVDPLAASLADALWRAHRHGRRARRPHRRRHRRGSPARARGAGGHDDDARRYSAPLRSRDRCDACAHRAAPLSPSCPRMTISARTRSSARRPTPFRCASARTASIRISMPRETGDRAARRPPTRGSGWISTIPSISSRSWKCRRPCTTRTLASLNSRASPPVFWRRIGTSISAIPPP